MIGILASVLSTTHASISVFGFLESSDDNGFGGCAFAFLGLLAACSAIRITDLLKFLGSKVHEDPVTECYIHMDSSLSADSAIAQNDKNAPLPPNHGPNMVQYY
jgi:hypothetical protein